MAYYREDKKLKKKKIENQNNKKNGHLNLKVVENSLKLKLYNMRNDFKNDDIFNKQDNFENYFNNIIRPKNKIITKSSKNIKKYLNKAAMSLDIKKFNLLNKNIINTSRSFCKMKKKHKNNNFSSSNYQNSKLSINLLYQLYKNLKLYIFSYYKNIIDQV